MRIRRFVAGLLALLVIGVVAMPTLAASLTYPSSVTYTDTPTLKVSGLKASTAYILVLYDRFEQPTATFPFTSGADGNFSISRFSPDQTDMPGMYTFTVVSAADFSTVTSASATLSGTNTWFLDKRLGS